MTPEGLLPRYAGIIDEHLRAIVEHSGAAIRRAAERVADHVAEDGVVYVYGPGGHSNLASQEVFFRAGGLVNISAVLDEGTLLSNGALRSVAMERSPGYGRVVIGQLGLGPTDVIILVNAYGINSALIDAALTARECGTFVIGVSSRIHAESVPPDHPARHPSGRNLHDIVDLAVDSRVPLGDAVLERPGVVDAFGAISTFANAFVMQGIISEAICLLADRGIEPTIWRSANAPGGDERNARFLDRFRHRVQWL